MTAEFYHMHQADHAVPRPVQALRYEVFAASAGMNHSSFVTAGGTVYTCGYKEPPPYLTCYEIQLMAMLRQSGDATDVTSLPFCAGMGERAD